jgi:hypothetical protein
MSSTVLRDADHSTRQLSADATPSEAGPDGDGYLGLVLRLCAESDLPDAHEDSFDESAQKDGARKIDPRRVARELVVGRDRVEPRPAVVDGQAAKVSEVPASLERTQLAKVRPRQNRDCWRFVHCYAMR